MTEITNNDGAQPVVAQAAPVAQPEPILQEVPAQPAAPVVAQPVATVAPEIQQLAEQIAQPAPQPVSAQPNAYTGFELPQGVTDRTRDQFDKLTESNRRLLEANRVMQTELTRRTQVESAVAPLQQSVKPEQPDVTQFVETDPITGDQYVNEKKLQDAISQANDRALRAEQQIKTYIATQQQKEDERQAQEAYSAHPELVPHSQGFDQELSDLTEMYALNSMLYPSKYGGRTLTFKEAADLAARKLRGGQPVAPVAQVQQISAETQMNPQTNVQPTQQPVEQPASVLKEQGGMSVEGRPVNVDTSQADNNLLVLQDRTRRGDLYALARRLTSVPHTGTPTHGDDVGGE